MTEQPTSLRLPREIKAAIKKAASEKKWSFNLMVTEILKQWVAWSKAQK